MLPVVLLTSAPPAADASERNASVPADESGLLPVALLAAVDLSAPPSEGDAEHDKALFSMFLSDSLMAPAS